MFTKSTIALVVLLGITSNAFATTKKQPNPTSPGGVYINNPSHDRHNGATWDPNGLRWDCSCS
jgi:hypothetical protein